MADLSINFAGIKSPNLMNIENDILNNEEFLRALKEKLKTV